MAVQEQTPLQEYTANGITKQFDLEFDCESADHLIVSIDDLEVLHTDWYLLGNAIVFHVAPASGKQVKIQRNTPFNRIADYQSYNNSFRPPAINKDFDRIWWKLQELGVADWILGNRINALKTYVDRKDDELKAYLMDEIRKQGVALDQLDDYYNYLMQRLAQIAVDKGWDASFVVDGDKNQHQINSNTAYYYSTVAAMIADDSLKDGVIVGTKGYHNIFDEGGAVYLISSTATDYSIPLANGLHAIFRDSFDIRKFGIRDNATLDQTTEIKRMVNYADTRVYEIDFLNFSLQVPKIWTELATWHMENGSPVDTTLFMGMAFTQAHKLKNLKISHDKTVRLENAQCMIIFAPLHNPEFEQWFVLENIEFDAWNPNYSPVTDNYMGNGDGGRHGFFAYQKVGSSIPTHTPDIINYSYEFKNIHFKSPAYSYNLCPFITAKNVKFENLTGDYLALYLLQQSDNFIGSNLKAVYRDDLHEANRLLVTNAIHYEAEFTGKTVTHQLTDIKNISSVKKSTGEPYSAYVFHSLSDKITMNKFVLDNITGHCRLSNVNIIDAEYKNSRIGASFIVLNCPTVARLVIDNWVSNDNQGSYGSAPFLLRTPNIDYLEISNSELQYTLYVSGAAISATVNKLILNNIYINEVESFKSGIAYGANCNIKQLIANGLSLADGWQRIYTANVEYARLSDVNFGNGELLTIINNPSDVVSNVEILNSSSTRTNALYNNAVDGKINLKIINSSFADLIKVGLDVNIKYINSVVQITQTYDFPSLATATQQKTTFLWVGLRVGANLEVYFDKSLQGTRIWAEVESDNYVTVYHRNDTGATVDLPSGTLTVKLI